MRWAFAAVCGLSLVAVSRGYPLVAICGFLIAVASGTWASIVATCGLRSCGSRDPLVQGKLNPPGPGIKAMSPALAGGIPIHGTTREALKEHFTREKKLKPGWAFPRACLCGLTHPCSCTGRSFLVDTRHFPTGQGGSSKWYLSTLCMLPWVTPITEGPKWMGD